MKGKIIKGIGGFYYVHAEDNKIYECKAKGIFRKEGLKPLPGDNVEISVLSAEDEEGNIDSILPRKNVLIRPAAANIDSALIIFAVKNPEPNLNLLDRFLIYMEMQEIPVTIYFNKADLDKNDDCIRYKHIYENAGYQVITGSLTEDSPEYEETKSRIESALKGRTTILAGPSGVGKSSLTNMLHSNTVMEVGSISEKIKRGKHTTRHTEIFSLSDDTYILDTPGFTSLYLTGIKPEELRRYFPEFSEYEEKCRYSGCVHMGEPEAVCAVKRAVKEGLIPELRYDNYVQIYNELKSGTAGHR